MSRQIGDIPSRAFGPGDVVFREGDGANGEAYMVHEGRVEVRRRFGEEERVLRTLAKGELLGEIALFRNAPRSATAVAAEPTVLLVIPAQRLEHMVRSNGALAVALIRQLANQMLQAEERARQAEERAREAEQRARDAEERWRQARGGSGSAPA
jgi:CRP-like cAMP-binding protein